MSEASRIEADAARWLARRQQGFAPAEARQFEAWLAADPRHAESLGRLEAAWRLMNFPQRQGRADEALQRLGALARTRRIRRIWSAAAAGVAAAVLAATFWIQRPDRLSRQRDASTITFLQPGHQVLPDGSQVDLNAGAKIAVDFSPGRRGIRLLGGEAFFSVAHDTARPFVVAASEVEVRAVGTQFSVRCDSREVAVIVTQGKVSLRRAGGAEDRVEAALAPPTLAAGQGIRLTPTDWTARGALGGAAVRGYSPAELSAALAWRNGQVKFNRTPLSAAIRIFNEAGSERIVISDSQVARLPLSGTLTLGRPEAFVRLLEQGFGIEAVRAGGAIELRRRAL